MKITKALERRRFQRLRRRRRPSTQMAAGLVIVAAFSDNGHMRRRDPRVKSAVAGYPGGKASGAVWRRIINQIPPHDIYIEPFLGGGAVLFYKRPARLLDVGVDINGVTIADTSKYITGPRLYVGDGLEYLRDLLAAISGPKRRRTPGVDRRYRRRQFPELAIHAARTNDAAAPSIVVYCDPPYLLSSRRSAERRYMWEASDQVHDGQDERWHKALLKLLNELPCYVLLSGYDSPLYRKLLNQKKWRVISYKAPIRGGNVATEFLWCNFPQPSELHDYRFLGENRRERERIKRKKARWVNKLKVMPDLERYAILGALQETRANVNTV